MTKVVGNSSSGSSNSIGRSQQQQQQQPSSVTAPHEVVLAAGSYYRFRCLALQQHLDAAFVMVNVLNYDWFVQLPPNINAGQYFMFSVQAKDIQMAKELHELYGASRTNAGIVRTTTSTISDELREKTVEMLKQLPPNTTKVEQQKQILRFLQPSLHIVTDSEIERVGKYKLPSIYAEIYAHPYRCIVTHFAFCVSFVCGFIVANTIRYHW
jgi:hypothetical protein